MLQIQKASAGSGKTFALTRQYITMLLGRRDESGRMRLYRPDDYGFLKPKAHGRILAITFTNKATQEMTSRIISELSLLSNNEGRRSGHLEYLTRLYAATPPQVCETARRALADLLFNFSWFNVSTIDSFFQNVLRIFTRELDLPETFNLEIDDRYPVAVAIGEMLGSINLPLRGCDPERAKRLRLLKSWLKSYMDSLIEDGVNANLLARSSKINRALTTTISTLRGESFKTHSRKILDYLSDPERIGRFARGLSESLARHKDSVVEAAGGFLGLDEAQWLPKALREDYLERWAVGDFSFSPFAGSGRSTLPKALEPDGKRHNKLPKGAVWSDDVDNLLLRILRLGLSYFEDEMFYTLLRRQIYLLGLFSEACNHIDEYCRENEAFLLGDTNSLLRKVICEVEAPFVYERIGYMINHFLIDEFQDTSEMQWDNLRPLVMESMSRDKDNLIIGDEKQCIYRFRNSNPELLGSKVETAVGRRFGQEKVNIGGTTIDQNTNWRSSREVVMFNNSLFACLSRLVDRGMAIPMAARTYSGLIQQVAPKNLDFHGYVKVIFGPEKDFIPDTPEADGQKGYETWTQDDILRHLGQEIDRELSAGYRPGEIAVLVRTHAQGQAVISYLLDLMRDSGWSHGHVDIISSDALEISTSPAVQLVIGILRLTTTPQYVVDTDRQPVDGRPVMKPNPDFLRNRLIHRYELCVFDQTDMTAPDGSPVLDAQGKPLLRRLTAEEALRKAIAATSPLPGEPNPDPLQQRLDQESAKAAEMDCPSLFAITERIIRDYLPRESRREEAAFLAAFQDLVTDFEEQGDSDVESFLRWWDGRGRYATLPAPEGMDAINVMTIHQSKGLEFGCVHIPFCSNRLVKYDGEEWYRLDREGFPGIDPEDVPPFIPLKNRSAYSKIPMLAPQIERYAQLQLVDSLNVAYVAFTRAVSELVVYADPSSSRGETLGTLLLEAARSLHTDAIASYGLSEEETRWMLPLVPHLREETDGEMTLTIGDPTEVVALAVAQASSLSPSPKEHESGMGERGEMGDRLEACATSFDAEIPYDTIMEEYHIERPAEMILPDDVEQQGVFDITDERHVGNFLHDALSRVERLDDLPQAMSRAAYRRAIPEREWRPYLDRLTEALHDPRVRPWFEDYEILMTERPLTAPDGLRRPDRVVVMPSGEMVVIDYKFGVPRKKYRDQVRGYMALLHQCGYTDLHGYLFHPLTGELISVD